MKIGYLWFGLILLYLLPTFIQAEFDKENHIIRIGLALPRIISGDEQAYLVGINSLTKDLDINLKNNYDNARFGGTCEAGYNFRNKAITRHVHFFHNGTDYSSNFFGPDSRLKQELKYYDFGMFEQQPPFHPIGIPLLISMFLWPLKDLCLLEVFTIFFSIGMSLITLLCLYKILLYYKDDKRRAFFITAVIALGTPLWFYSKTLFPEPYITPILLISYYLFIVRKQLILPAIFLGVGMLMKYPFAIFPAIFCCYLLLRRRIYDLIKFGLMVSIFGGFLFLYNYLIYSGAFSQSYGYGSILEGLIGIPFSPTRGILFFAPFLFFTILGMKNFYKAHKNESLLTLSLILSYYIFISTFPGWWGGGFASRNMVPIIPLFGIVLFFWYAYNPNTKIKYLFYFLAITSIFINFQAAFFHIAFWGEKPPWHLISLLFTKLPRILEVFLG